MAPISIGPGWNLSDRGYSTISENNTITDRNILLKNALNADLKEIGTAALNKELSKNKIVELVLQIQKIRNVAAPKANEDSNAAPRMLKLTLTDGETFIQAIEILTIPFISRDRTPPGSKVLIKDAKVQNGFLLLNQNNIKLLGGNVPHLFDKWELAKSVQHHSRILATSDGPPAWVNFGTKLSNTIDGSKISDSSKTKEQVKENIEFENLRKDAIAEAATGAVKKVFGAGAKLVNAPPRNDTNRTRNENNKSSNRGKKDIKASKESLPQKPSDKVSLFDFLENKLQIAGPSGDSKISHEEEEKKDYQIGQNSHHQTEMRKEVDDGHRNGAGSRYSHNHEQYRNSNIKKQISYHGESENYKRPFRNRDIMGTFKSHDHANSPRTETNEFSNRQNYRNSPLTKNSNVKQQIDNSKNFHNTESQINKKSNVDDSNSPKTNQIGRRNEEERMQDNWHYRAPHFNNQEPNKNSNNLDSLTDHVAKMSIGGEFASRSLRQHLNLQGKKQTTPRNTVEMNENDHSGSFNVGDDCLAKYWEDNKFYPSKITASTETTYVVQFKGYGNIEEVLRSDCIPLDNERAEKKKHKGTLEFRRNARKYVVS